MILTPDQRLRVFVSSTLDLTEERAAARRSVEALNLTPVMFETGARPYPPRALYRAYVVQSDVFVAIYAKRYGWTAPGMEVSGLEDEFILSAGMPRLVYIQLGVEREPQLRAFLERVRDGGLSYKPFSTAADLEELLRNDLVVLLTERFHTTDGAVASEGRARRAPLPRPATGFLGRDADVAEITARLQRGDVRLLTLVGPGGIGKTRLAIETGRRLGPQVPGGTFYVSLAALREPGLVADTVAAALDVATIDASRAVAAVADAIGDGRTLLILDNFEHVVPGATVVAELLEACESLTVVVTSRTPLRLRGEHEFPVRPLAVPTERTPSERVRDYSAVQLFIEAARAVRPDLVLDERSTAAVVDICRELDGLPLALELAAAMVRIMTPEMVLDRLRDQLLDLNGGRRDMPARHQSLAATIAWSYDLLDGPTKDAFAQLSAFRGGFTLATAERVCDVERGVVPAVASLVEHSLVRADVRAEHVRFEMLGTIRRFARERLNASGGRDAVFSRHARTFLELADQVGRPGGRHRAVLDAMEIELDNVRQAFTWLLASDDPDPVANAVWQSWWFWWMRGYLKEGKLWADRCLKAPQTGREPHARVLAARAMFAIWSGDYDFAVPALREAAAVAREIGDDRSLGYADVAVGLVHGLTGAMADGLATIRRGVATFDRIADEVGATTGLVAMSWMQGITRQFDDTDELLRHALRRARGIDSKVDMGVAEAALAQFRMSRGDDTDGVHDLISASLEHLAEARHIASTILTLEVIAELGMHQGLPRASVELLGATAAIRSSMGTHVPPQAAARLAQLIEHGRRRLGTGFDSAFGHGSTMSLDDAVDRGRSLLGDLRQTAQ